MGNNYHNTAIRKTDSNTVCWGSALNADQGSLGWDAYHIWNKVTSNSSPILVVGNHSFVDIAAGATSNFGLKADTGAVWAWGSNTAGNLGDNTRTSRSSPVVVVGSHSFRQVVSGGSNTYGLKDTGEVWAWGTDFYGQLGRGTSQASASSPVLVVGNHSFVSLAVMFVSVFGLKSDGSVWSWGLNDRGQLATGNVVSYSSPVAIVGNHSFIGISTGNAHIFCLKANGEVWAWGYDNAGQLGINSAIESRASVSSPVAVVGNHSFYRITSGGGYHHSLFLKRDTGAAWACGNNAAGALGTNDRINYSSPVAVVGNHSFVKVACGPSLNVYYSMALKDNGELWSWGSGAYGQLGQNTGTLVSCSSPIIVVGNHSFIDVCCGNSCSPLALKADGSVWSWGNDNMGQLGHSPSQASCSSPVLVVGSHSFIGIATGWVSGYGLKANGEVWGWGYNGYGGLLGAGTVNNDGTEALPTAVAGSHSFTTITPGGSEAYDFTVALKASTGEVWCWGTNRYGETGDNTNVTKSSPVLVVGNHSFIKVVNAELSAAALKSNGEVWTWGAGAYGTLGIYSVASYSSPVLVIGSHSFIDIVADGQGGCIYGRKDNGEVWSWGRGVQGQMGVGDRVTYSSPVLVVGNHSFISLFADGSYGVWAGKDDGTTWCWGGNTKGSLGAGTTISYSSPVLMLGNHSFNKIVAGSLGDTTDFFGIGLKSNGEVWCWGSNTFGQLGENKQGGIKDRSSPVLVVGNHSFIDVAAKDAVAYALKANGELWAWGGNTAYFGDGGPSRSFSSPVLIIGNSSFTKISAHLGNNFGIDGNGQAWGWGGNSAGSLGINYGQFSYSSPILVIGNHSFTQISSGSYHAAGLKANGEVWAWGYNVVGDLGNGTTTNIGSPVKVIGNHSFIQIASGGYGTWALKDDGSVWAWGDNTYGQLGNSTSPAGSSSSPVLVVGNHSFASIHSGFYHCFGRKTDGSVWGWGLDGAGQLGINYTAVSATSPIIVVGNHSFVEISAGYTNSCARKSDGSVWAWGSAVNELGADSSPILVVGNHSFISVCAGDLSNYGLKSDGSVWSWGYNSYGQLGNFTTTNSSSPISVVGNHSFIKIKAATNIDPSILALKANGEMWGWGDNVSGQLGNYSNYAVSSPSESLTGSHAFITISSGMYYNFGLKSDGTVWSWGAPTGGCLGDGTTTLRYSPVQVIGNHSFIFVKAGCGQTNYNGGIATKQDGTLWAWGTNSGYQLGQGDTINYSSPVQITNSAGTLFSKALLSEGWGMALEKSTGLGFGWGTQTYGQCGTGDRTTYGSPHAVVGNHSFIQIDASAQSCFGLKSNGEVWAWGAGPNGILGTNVDVLPYSSPILVVGNHSFIQITVSTSTSGASAYGLKANGEVWGWGSNGTGQLGHNDRINYSSPVLVVGSHSFWGIAGGSAACSALKKNGELWVLGGAGEYLGIGSNTASVSSPVLVIGGYSWKYMSNNGPTNINTWKFKLAGISNLDIKTITTVPIENISKVLGTQ